MDCQIDTSAIKSCLFVTTGLLKDMPNGKQGQVYYATDTRETYLFSDNIWTKMANCKDDNQEYPKIKVNRHTHCPSCGARINKSLDHCDYCGTPYEYDYV